MSLEYQILTWDTKFFGFKVAKIIKPIDEMRALNDTLKNLPEDISLIYFHAETDIEKTEEIVKGFKMKYVDEKITFKKYLDNYTPFEAEYISSYSADYPSPILIDLAIQSGIYSRFNRDEQIGQSKFEELYTLWMTNSVSREIAEEVLVYTYEDEIAGMVTLGIKNGRSDIGIIAVDTKYRGKGIGSALVGAAEKWSLENGRKVLQVLTQGKNQKACNFYKQLGYGVEKVDHFYHIWKM